ncbi:MAG: hypothetical protein IK122_01930 [Alphaproteobacteria bacterium]|nr:hypothetical protein [Alphaproteobacteria bacterium]
MIKSNIRFLSSVLVMSVFGMASVSAAPSVKMLGSNTARVGSNTSVVKTNNTAAPTTQRLGSIRPTNVGSGMPVTVTKVPSKVNTVNTVSTTDSGDAARLSLGKYIHSTGVSAGTIKPSTGSSSNAGVSSSDFVNLVDRVQNLENGKQDTIAAGDGLVKSGNTISLDPVTLGDAVSDILGEDYYTADEIDEMLDGIGGGSSTYPSTTQQDVNYDSISVVDKFDENFDFTE